MRRKKLWFNDYEYQEVDPLNTYSVTMHENTDQKKTPNSDTFLLISENLFMLVEYALPRKLDITDK